MMSLILAPKSIKGIEEKFLKTQDQKSTPKYSKITKMKNITAQHRR
jgi:hypothetical protein